MTLCELDDGVSGEALGWPLPAWQALLLHRFLPSCGGLAVYIVLICFDVALVVEHFENGSPSMGSFCILLFLLPALASLVFTLASPPPGLRPEDGTALTVTLDRGDVCWLLLQIVNFFFFPVAAICRYCHLIFWSMEAVCAAYVNDAPRAKDALVKVRAPSPLELYLFLQSFLHAAPHALINILDMLSYKDQPAFDLVAVQAVSVVVSMMRMASTATIYRRFEREKLCGKRYPWALETDALLENEINERKVQSDHTDNVETVAVVELYNEPTISGTTRYSTNNFNSLTPKNIDKSFSFINNLSSTLTLSSSGSEEYLKPVTKSSPKFHREDSYEQAVHRMSIIERVAPRRNPDRFNIETVDLPPPPVTPAPRPMSISVWAEKLIENAETFPEKISAPQRRRYIPEIVQTVEILSQNAIDSVPMPVALPRTSMRGLEPQDASAAIVHYFAWYLFFIARLLSIAIFIRFHPFAGIIVLMGHYQLMLLLLIIPDASTVKRCFYVFLGFVYIFCLLEFKIRFRHVRAWHVFWLVLCTVEIVVFAGVWVTLGSQDVNWWWQSFMLTVIFGSILLSYMCMLVYFVLLKPNETVVIISSVQQTS